MEPVTDPRLDPTARSAGRGDFVLDRKPLAKPDSGPRHPARAAADSGRSRSGQTTPTLRQPEPPDGNAAPVQPAKRKSGRLDPAKRTSAQTQPAPPSNKRPRSKKGRTEPVVAPADICSIVFCDQDLIAVDKAAGFPVVPSGAFHKRSVLLALAELGFGNLFPISMLDPEATGLVLLSRSEAAARALRWNWRSNLCERQYIAVAQGDIVGARGRITLTIGAAKSGPHAHRHQVLPAEDGGRPAVTTWKLLARGRGLSRLLVTLKGGRCHQIRIHLSAIGFPVVGDRVYGLERSEVPLSALIDVPSKHRDATTLPPNQIALHCHRIQMPHPISNQPMELVAPVPRILLGLMPGAWVVDAA